MKTIKTSLLTLAGIVALASFANAYPKYENGPKLRPQNRTVTTIAVMANSQASAGVVHPIPFKKGAGYVRH